MGTRLTFGDQTCFFQMVENACFPLRSRASCIGSVIRNKMMVMGWGWVVIGQETVMTGWRWQSWVGGGYDGVVKGGRI